MCRAFAFPKDQHLSTTDEYASALMKDRARLTAMVRALSASDLTLRRERCRGELGDYAVIGKSGHIYPDGGSGWLLYVETSYRDDAGKLIDGSVRRWNNIKARLAFCRVTQDGDDEGCLHLDHMPTEAEAGLIRDALGIRKRREMTEAGRAQLEAARKAANSVSGGRTFV